MTPTLRKTLTSFLLFGLGGFASAVLVLSAVYLYLSPNLPSVESIRDVRLQTPLKIYSTDGKLIGEFGEKRRDPASIEEVPQPLIDALLAAEDADFFSHQGVSIRGLARAFKELITTGKRGSGGSTLTMQLTRNVFFSLEKKFSRKFNEIILAMKLERELSKDEILELYMNYMYLGNRAYGVKAAAQAYYGKELKDLSTAQMAMIAGSFQLPSTKNAIANAEWAKERRNWILSRMKKLGSVTQEEYQAAIDEPVTATYHGSPLDISAPYVAELAREKTIRSFGLQAYTEGYSVYTTVDSRLQIAAQEALIKGLHAYDARHGYRGPEQQLPLQLLSNLLEKPEAEVETTEGENKTAQNLNDEQLEEQIETAPLPLKNEAHPWLAQLNDIPDYGDLIAAAVTGIDDTGATLLFKDGSYAKLLWENGIAQARPYINENARGAKPSGTADVLAVGDVIRVQANADQQWTLSQLPAAQAALISLNPSNGAILSVVGGYNFYENNFNRATQAYRQPGSGLKPFIYATGLEKGMTAASLINDSPITLSASDYEGTWRPRNDDGKFYGPMRLRRALYLSKNLVSVRVMQQLGIANAVNALERFGFDRKSLARDLSLSLGNASVTPEKMAEAWSIFANGGHRVNAHLIDRVVDHDNNIIYEALPDTVCDDCDSRSPHYTILEPTIESDINDPDFDANAFSLPIALKRSLGLLEEGDYPRAAKVMDDQVAFIMDSILKDVIQKGTGRSARSLKRSDLGGKTGTTNGPNDSWFNGYSRDVATAVWVGFDQNTPLGDREYGGTAALPIWIDYMAEALKDTRSKHKPQPEGVVTVKIDPDTGQRARIDDPDAIFEYFRTEYAPELEPETGAGTEQTQQEIISEEIF